MFLSKNERTSTHPYPCPLHTLHSRTLPLYGFSPRERGMKETFFVQHVHVGLQTAVAKIQRVLFVVPVETREIPLPLWLSRNKRRNSISTRHFHPGKGRVGYWSSRSIGLSCSAGKTRKTHVAMGKDDNEWNAPNSILGRRLYNREKGEKQQEAIRR